MPPAAGGDARTALALAVVIAAVFFLSFFQVSSPDTFWHLAAGETMLDQGRLLTHNTFSHTYPDYPWTNMEWLFQVALALLYRAGGLTALLLFKVLVLCLAAALLFRLLQRWCSPGAAAAVVILAFGAMRFRFLVRPHILSLLFFVLLLFLAEDLPRRWKRRLVLLLPLFALWSNVHPEFLFGLAYLGAIALVELASPAEEKHRGGRGLATVVALCTLATLANPGFAHSLLLPLKVVGLEEVVAISEYDFSSPDRVPLFWLCTAATAVSFAFANPRERWRRLPVFILFAILGFAFLRAAAYSLAASALLFCRNLSEARVAPRQRLVIGILAATALVGFTYAMHFDRNLPYRWGTGVREVVFPIAAADFIEKEGPPRTLYNHYAFGGYLIHRLYPRYGVFQDGRFFPYPPDFLARSDGRFDPADWQLLLKEHGVMTALAFARDVGGLFSLRDWAVVYWDDRFAVLLRRGAASSGLVERLEYRHFYPGSGAPTGRERGYLEELLREMSRNQVERLRPSAAVEWERGGILELLGREEESRRAFDEALLLDDDPGGG